MQIVDFIYFYELSLKKVRERKAEYINALSEGQAQSFEGYRFLCGKVQAINEVEEVLRDLFDLIQNNRKGKNTKENAQLY